MRAHHIKLFIEMLIARIATYKAVSQWIGIYLFFIVQVRDLETQIDKLQDEIKKINTDRFCMRVQALVCVCVCVCVCECVCVCVCVCVCMLQ